MKNIVGDVLQRRHCGCDDRVDGHHPHGLEEVLSRRKLI